MGSTVDNTEELISDLEDRIVEITQSEQQKEKGYFFKKSKYTPGKCDSVGWSSVP